jgi:hypothetical protein
MRDPCEIHARSMRDPCRADPMVVVAGVHAVDVVLYFFAPHRIKRADLELLKRLQGKASIVPVLAKARWLDLT